MATTLAEALRRFGPEVLARRQARGQPLTSAQAKAWRAILACRTPALGGEHLCCPACGAEQWRWHSCRNRHCPRCQSRQREAWRRARGAELLDVPYCHLVFTLPHELNALAAAQPRWVYGALFDTVAATLTQFAADPRWLGGIGAFTLVLHTWTQDLRRHLHLHALMACGALARDADGQAHWQPPRRSASFLFPVHALSAVFKGKFLAALREAESSGRLRADPQVHERAQRTQALQAKPWVVYAKTALAGPAAVLDYLSRYTQRTAIGHERLRAVTAQSVRFVTRVNRAQRGRAEPGATPHRRLTSLPGEEFVERLLQHVLPSGFKRVRHYGLLAPAAKAQRLACARALLAMPAAQPATQEDVAEFMRRVAGLDITTCPHCRGGRWRVLEQRGPQPCPAMLATQERRGRACRGPPDRTAG